MDDFAHAAADVMARVRKRRPLVHHITNFVVMNETANMTLCAGALPVMAHAREEVEDMVTAAGALVLNLGTLWPDHVESMLLAGRRANACDVPVVLDPVGAGATRLRTDSARRLLDSLTITITRGNLAEIAVLAGYDAKISGVESLAGGCDRVVVATEFARKFGGVAAVTGAVDVVTDGERVVRVHNGHPLMGMVTGTGCMATSLMAAYAAVEKADYVVAAASALAAFGLAGQIAAEKAEGPGTFHAFLYDAVAGLTADVLRAGARIEVMVG